MGLSSMRGFEHMAGLYGGVPEAANQRPAPGLLEAERPVIGWLRHSSSNRVATSSPSGLNGETTFICTTRKTCRESGDAAPDLLVLGTCCMQHK